MNPLNVAQGRCKWRRGAHPRAAVPRFRAFAASALATPGGRLGAGTSVRKVKLLHEARTARGGLAAPLALAMFCLWLSTASRSFFSTELAQLSIAWRPSAMTSSVPAVMSSMAVAGRGVDRVQKCGRPLLHPGSKTEQSGTREFPPAAYSAHPARSADRGPVGGQRFSLPRALGRRGCPCSS